MAVSIRDSSWRCRRTRPRACMASVILLACHESHLRVSPPPPTLSERLQSHLRGPRLHRKSQCRRARPRECESLLRIFMNVYRAPRFIRGVADIFQWALGAFRSARHAELASVPDDLVRKERPFLARDHLHEILLDFLRVLVARKLQPARNALHM